MMTGILTGNQKQAINLFQNKTNEEQAKLIADKCNELGITKEQLQGILSTLNKKK